MRSRAEAEQRRPVAAFEEAWFMQMARDWATADRPGLAAQREAAAQAAARRDGRAG
jgi:hypothetical protein